MQKADTDKSNTSWKNKRWREVHFNSTIIWCFPALRRLESIGGEAGLCGLFQHTQIMKKRQIATNFGPKTVDAYDEFELFGESFFLNKHQGKWGVTHTKTGASASTWCKSKKAAIDEARGNFERAFKSGETTQSILAECKPLIPA